jgi:ornithine racemase
MAFTVLYRENLRHNFQFLDKLFRNKGIEWGVVSKLLCGNKTYLRELLDLGIREIHDSRISNLKAIKSLDPTVQTVYIKPPAKRSIPNLIKYADVSFNTELETIQLLSEQAGLQKKTHKIIIMVEMGDLREGVMGESLISFYEKVFNLPRIEIIGIGTNLNCLNGILPTQDKLIQLSLYKQLIEAKFNMKIPWVSGGTSVAIPLILKQIRPLGVNHFRVGETLFFGNDLFTEKPIKGMKTDVFRLFTEIIELIEKPMVPSGIRAKNAAGKMTNIDESKLGATSFRAIVDIGLLDMSPEYLTPVDPEIKILEASSDMLVLDLGRSRRSLRVGDLVAFRLKYMGALRVFNSMYIDKEVRQSEFSLY